MQVTIKDIAKKAGVSHTTVSRALNGNIVIPEKTAASIRALAVEMGYVPSAAARRLKTNHSQVLGVIVSRIDNPYFGEILQGIEDVCQSKGYSVFIASTNLDESHEKTIIQAFGEHRVDGVIISSVSFNLDHAETLKKYNIPIVVINNQSPHDYQNAIAHDDFYGARQVTEHLISLGHRRIAYLGNHQAARVNQDRLHGYRRSLELEGLSFVPSLVVQQGGSDIEDGEAGMLKLLGLSPIPTAVFCFNDLMAIGALKLLQRKGISVPESISITGFDNIPYSAYTTPPLTTFDQPKREIGSEAADLILELIHSNKISIESERLSTRLIRGKLLVRESTAQYQNKEIE